MDIIWKFLASAIDPKPNTVYCYAFYAVQPSQVSTSFHSAQGN